MLLSGSRRGNRAGGDVLEYCRGKIPEKGKIFRKRVLLVVGGKRVHFSRERVQKNLLVQVIEMNKDDMPEGGRVVLPQYLKQGGRIAFTNSRAGSSAKNGKGINRTLTETLEREKKGGQPIKKNERGPRLSITEGRGKEDSLANTDLRLRGSQSAGRMEWDRRWVRRRGANIAPGKVEDRLPLETGQ